MFTIFLKSGSYMYMHVQFALYFNSGKRKEIEAGIDGFMVFDLNFLKPTQMVRLTFMLCLSSAPYFSNVE